MSASSTHAQARGGRSTAIPTAPSRTPRRPATTREFDALVWQWAPLFVGSGRSATVQRWLDSFAPEEIARRPALVVMAAWAGVTSGDLRAFDHWAQIATTVTPDVPLPDGTPLEAPLAMLHATIGRRGIERMREDAARAYELDHSTSPFRSVAKFLEGAALRLSGDLPAARACCSEAAAVGRLSAPAVAVHALAQLGLIEIELGDWSAAAAHFEDSLGVIEQFGLGERPALGAHVRRLRRCSRRTTARRRTRSATPSTRSGWCR